MIKTCKFCNKIFYGTGTAAYCEGPHYKSCEICNQLFEWDYKRPKRCCSKKCSIELRKRSIQSSTKVCELCGKEFHPRSNTQRYCDDIHYNSCPVCGKPVKITFEYDPRACCSQACTNELRKRTCLEKYGVAVASQAAVVRQKLSETARSDEVASRRKQTSLKHWGVDNPAKHKDVKAKISSTVKSDECQSRMRQTTVERYGTSYAMQSDIIMNKYKDTIQSKYGVPYFCMTAKCKEAQGDIVSSINRQVGNKLAQQNITYKFEHRIDEYSYDIFVPSCNTLIEVNPTYTHNAIGNHWGDGLPKMYHRDKTRLAKEHGYRCINIWDWDSVDKVVKMLCDKRPLYARKCKLEVIDSRTAEVFENMYHLQGKVRGQEVCLGLYYAGELVEVMTFGKPRYNKNYEWELLRLCSNSSYAVVGGAEKMWKYFIRNYSPKSVISYCDLSKFSGDVYERLGMVCDGYTEPNKIWSKGSEMITNNFLLQRGYDQIFNADFGKGTSNEELMIENGWLPVYDCGQIRFVW